MCVLTGNIGLAPEKKLEEGKEKIVATTEMDSAVRIYLKDVFTASNGAMRKILEGSGSFKTTQACNIFSFLRLKGVKNHFLDKYDNISFRALSCEMFPLEVVIRRTAPPCSSYLKRNPKVKEGAIFDDLIVEFFFKDDARGDPFVYMGGGTKKWIFSDQAKPVREGEEIGSIPTFLTGAEVARVRRMEQRSFPVIEEVFVTDKWLLFDQAKPIMEGQEIGSIPALLTGAEVARVRRMAQKSFLILEEVFAKKGVILHDLKEEYGRVRSGRSAGDIVLADTITSDEMRLTENGAVLGKDVVRSGGDMTTTGKDYARIAALTNTFFDFLEEEVGG